MLHSRSSFSHRIRHERRARCDEQAQHVAASHRLGGPFRGVFRRQDRPGEKREGK